MIIMDALSVFRQGKELTNAATWKNRTMAIDALVGFLGAVVALAGGLGYPLPIDKDAINGLAVGVVSIMSVFNVVMHTITSSKVGLPPVGNAGQ